MRGVTVDTVIAAVVGSISTHTPHARRDLPQPRSTDICSISTHTPHARRDIKPLSEQVTIAISTHTPHARRDDIDFSQIKVNCEFQLTRLMRGVTTCFLSFFLFPENFNSHASCEA